MSKLYSGCDLDRSQTELPADYLPQAPAVMIAGEDLLREAGYVPGSRRPPGWKPFGAGAFIKRSSDGKHVLRVRQCGNSRSPWVTERLRDLFDEPAWDDCQKLEALVLPFGPRPIWALTPQAAMRLAEYPPVAGYWADTGFCS
jgi:hypothetical protein